MLLLLLPWAWMCLYKSVLTTQRLLALLHLPAAPSEAIGQWLLFWSALSTLALGRIFATIT